MQFMGAGFSVSHSLCSKLVGASLSMGYSFIDAQSSEKWKPLFSTGMQMVLALKRLCSVKTFWTLVLKMNNQMISLLDGMLEANQELLFSHLERTVTVLVAISAPPMGDVTSSWSLWELKPTDCDSL